MADGKWQIPRRANEFLSQIAMLLLLAFLFLTLLLLAFGGHYRQHDGPENNPGDDQQRNRDWDLDLEREWRLSIVRIEQHFYSDKDQGNRQTRFQVTEIANRANENEIERPQPQNGKNVGSEHNEGLGGHCKNRGD